MNATPLADEVRKLADIHWDGDYRQEEIRDLADRVAAKERDLAEAIGAAKQAVLAIESHSTPIEMAARKRVAALSAKEAEGGGR